MDPKQDRMRMIARVTAISLGAMLAITFLPECGGFVQLRKVTGYYECVRPEGVPEAITISGYGWLAWSNGDEQRQYQFELKGSERFRMATVDPEGEPTLWQEFNYTRQGDELYFTPKLAGSGCERWVQRKAPSKDSRPNSVPDPLQLSHVGGAALFDASGP